MIMELVQSGSEGYLLVPFLKITKKVPVSGETKNEGGKKQIKLKEGKM
jgi:hypothetical protein